MNALFLHACYLDVYTASLLHAGTFSVSVFHSAAVWCVPALRVPLVVLSKSLLKQKRVGRLVYLLLFQSHEAPFRLPSRCSCLPGQFSFIFPPALPLAAAVLPAAAAEGEE